MENQADKPVASEPPQTPDENSLEEAPIQSDRRRFLTAGAASVAGLALAGRASAQDEEKPRQEVSELTPLSAAGGEAGEVEVLNASTFFQELPQMRVISSHEDTLETTLESTSVERFVPTR